MSGKGGVGKSSVAALTAIGLARRGLATGVLDADITGPSIPKLFGLRRAPSPAEGALRPARTRHGIEVVSLNLFLEKEDDPVIWRGPLVAGAVRQFWTDVDWGRLDVLVVDLPPGTGDAPLTVMQSLPVDGVVMVSSPQELAVMVVKKAVRMTRRLEAEILGLVQNMSHITCPECGNRIEMFGPDRVREAARETGVRLIAEIPFDPLLTHLCDVGRVEDYPDSSPDAAETVGLLADAVDGARRAERNETGASESAGRTSNPREGRGESV